MAVDLRYSTNRNCRAWLERVLTSLEGTGVLEATRERYPAHYHIALFPTQYERYVDALTSRTTQRLGQVAYRVRTGDSLWTIARDHGTTVDVLKAKNGLRGSTIYAGQVLEVPQGR
jgi:LysM repeat protein